MYVKIIGIFLLLVGLANVFYLFRGNKPEGFWGSVLDFGLDRKLRGWISILPERFRQKAGHLVVALMFIPFGIYLLFFHSSGF